MLQARNLLVEFVIADSPDIIADFLLDHHFHVASEAGEIVGALHEIPGICHNHGLLSRPDTVNQYLDSGNTALVRIVRGVFPDRLDLAVKVIGEENDDIVPGAGFPVWFFVTSLFVVVHIACVLMLA